MTIHAGVVYRATTGKWLESVLSHPGSEVKLCSVSASNARRQWVSDIRRDDAHDSAVQTMTMAWQWPTHADVVDIVAGVKLTAWPRRLAHTHLALRRFGEVPVALIPAWRPQLPTRGRLLLGMSGGKTIGCQPPKRPTNPRT